MWAWAFCCNTEIQYSWKIWQFGQGSPKTPIACITVHRTMTSVGIVEVNSTKCFISTIYQKITSYTVFSFVSECWQNSRVLVTSIFPLSFVFNVHSVMCMHSIPILIRRFTFMCCLFVNLCVQMISRVGSSSVTPYHPLRSGNPVPRPTPVHKHRTNREVCVCVCMLCEYHLS